MSPVNQPSPPMTDYTYRTVDGGFMTWSEGLSDFSEAEALSLSANEEFDKVYFENWYAIPKLEVFHHVQHLRLVDWHAGTICSLLEARGRQQLARLELQNDNVTLDARWRPTLPAHLPPNLTSLSFIATKLGAAGIQALTDSPLAAQLERLQFVDVGLNAAAL